VRGVRGDYSSFDESSLLRSKIWGADIQLIRNLLDASLSERIFTKMGKVVKEDVDLRR
jgi:hypothetical protein